MMEIKALLKTMVDKDASDLYLTVGSPPVYRVEGVIYPVGDAALTTEDLDSFAKSVMNEQQRHDFNEKLEMDLVLSLPAVSRFRVNVFRQRGSIALVIRKIRYEIKSIAELGLPPLLSELILLKRGLILVVGATGTGKSTTLAAMIDHRNSYGSGHVITIEDPIEFVHKHKKCLVNQRELGFDTLSFSDALKRAVRQAPDVVVIGEVRDSESMEAAITLADTGHLCLATLHASNASQAFERIINFFPEVRRPQLFMQLSLNLRAIISQRLIPSLEDEKRVAAIEVLIDTPRIKDLIKCGEIDSLQDAMERSVHEGCQSFDHALFQLYQEGQISLEQALANADSANNLRLKIKLEGMKEKAEDKTFKLKKDLSGRAI